MTANVLTLADLEEAMRKVRRATAEASGLAHRPSAVCPTCFEHDLYYGVVVPLAKPHFLMCCSCGKGLNW